MFNQPSAQRLFFFVFLLCAGGYTGWGQEQEASAVSVLRTQTYALAEEIIQKLRVPPNSSLALSIEGGVNKEFTTNVFLDALQKKGFTVSAQDAVGVLEILVLAQRVAFDEPNLGEWKRTTQTALEARLRWSSDGRVEYVGNSEHMMIDIVSQKEDGWWSSSEGALLASSSPGVLEKVLIPLTVIAATVVMVYLFFTVRN